MDVLAKQRYHCEGPFLLVGNRFYYGRGILIREENYTTSIPR